VQANLAVAEMHQGHHHRADDELRLALVSCVRTGDPAARAYALTCRATVGRLLGRYEDATASLRQALDLCRDLGDQSGEANARNGLGQLALADSRPGDARAQHGPPWIWHPGPRRL
jgi:Tetratricopeptide repeat